MRAARRPVTLTKSQNSTLYPAEVHWSMADREAAEDSGGEHGGATAVSGVCAEGGSDHPGLFGADS